jgi:hypothetical protein
MSAAVLLTTRLASDLAVVGEDLASGDEVGAGDAVEVRDRGFLVGEGSRAGKSPWGRERVDTIFAIRGSGWQ